MKECKYCNTPIGGDIPSDHLFLIDENIEKNVNLSVKGNGLSAECNAVEYFSMWADVCGDEFVMCLNEEDEEWNIEKENVFKLKINFCPICGRKLLD